MIKQFQKNIQLKKGKQLKLNMAAFVKEKYLRESAKELKGNF